MPHPLIQEIRTVARRAKRLLIVYGAAAVSVTLLISALAAAVVDYAFRIHDPGIRLMLSIAVLLAAAAGVHRFLLPALRRRWTDVEIARRLERRFPHLRDRLSSTIDFLNQPEHEPTAGSAALRRAVITETVDEVQRLPLDDVIDARRPRGMVAVASAVVLVLSLLALASPFVARVAAKRILMPWGTDDWPRDHHLQFDAPPQRVASESNVELSVVDRNGHLPDSVKILVGYEDDDENLIRPRNMQRRGDRMVHQLQNVTRNLRYRAVGGDDIHMPWHSLRVVQPPRLDRLSIQLQPPAYTGWPTTTAENHLRVLAGTRASVTGKASVPLARARLIVNSNTNATELTATLETSNRQLRLPADSDRTWSINESGSYRLELTDTQGLSHSGNTYEISVTPDREPVITMEQPTVHALVTANAAIRLRGLVKDDLAVQSIDLRYGRSNQVDEPSAVISLYRGPERVSVSTDATLDVLSQAEDIQTVDYDWDLRQFAKLQPGETLSFHIAASDYLPQQATSDRLRITIITASRLDERISRAQTRIVDRLARILQLQRNARTQVSELDIRWRELRLVDQPGIEQLRGTEMKQREVHRQLIGQDDSVLRQVQEVLAELEVNRIQTGETDAALRQLLATLRELSREHLSRIERQLAACAAAIQTTPQDSDAETDVGAAASRKVNAAIVQPLTDAGQHQDTVITTLEDLINWLAQHEAFGRLRHDVRILRQDQSELASQTIQLRDTTLGKPMSTLTPTQRSDLKRLAQRQSELARRFDNLVTRMEQIRDQVSQSDPAIEAAIEDSLDLVSRLSLPGQMRQCSRGIEQNRMGDATQQQTEIDDGLRELLTILDPDQQREAQRQLQQLQRAAAKLEGQIRKETRWRGDLSKADVQSDSQQRQRQLQRLERERQQMANELRRLARRLERLRAPRAADSVAKAAETASQTAPTDQTSRAAEQSKQTESELQQALQQLAERIRQAEADLARQQLAQLQQLLQGMADRQQGIIDETVRLEDIRVDHGILSPAQTISLQELSAEQRLLSVEADGLSHKLEPWEVFHLALSSVIQQMVGAADRLAQSDTSEETQQIEEEESRLRLQQMITALQPDPPPDDPDSQSDSGGAGQGDQEGQQPPPGPRDLQMLAQLKLLRQMQTEVQRRTLELDQLLRTPGGLTSGREQELIRLAREQGRLAELVLHMTSSGESPAPPINQPQPDDGDAGLDALDQLLEQSLEEALFPGIDEDLP